MTQDNALTCRQLIDFIADFLDGTLPAHLALAFERHLNECPSCAAYLDSYRATVRLGRLVALGSDAPASAAFPAKLIAAVRAARHAEP